MTDKTAHDMRILHQTFHDNCMTKTKTNGQISKNWLLGNLSTKVNNRMKSVVQNRNAVLLKTIRFHKQIKNILLKNVIKR